jgi:hypothetical protein
MVEVGVCEAVLDQCGRADAQIFCSRGPVSANGPVGFCFQVDPDSLNQLKALNSEWA